MSANTESTSMMRSTWPWARWRLYRMRSEQCRFIRSPQTTFGTSNFKKFAAALLYDWATSRGHLTWDVHLGSWTPSERLHNLRPKLHRLHAFTETNHIVFISHIWLLPDMIDSEIISNRCNHIWLCNRSLDGYTLKLQNDGRPCGVVRLYTSSSCSVPSGAWNVVLLKAFGYRFSSLLHANCAGPAVVLSPFSMERVLKRIQRRFCPRLIRARQGLTRRI